MNDPTPSRSGELANDAAASNDAVPAESADNLATTPLAVERDNRGPTRLGPSMQLRARPGSRLQTVVAVVVFAVLAFAPFVPFNIGVLSSKVNAPGSLQVLGVALIYAGFAVSYDLLFGYTGLLSFGHALPIGVSVYGANLVMMHAHLGWLPAALCLLVVNAALALVLGSIALRTTGVAFAMVTLAFAEGLALLVISDPFNVFGAEEGLPLASEQVPDFFRGVVNTKYLYWLALLVAVIVYAVASWMVRSRAGRVWEAVRENEARVHMIGLNPFGFKLASFVLASVLASACGSVYLLLANGANISITTADFTLGLLVMVVLGGSGRLWGAALGGFAYGLLLLRLGAVSTSDSISALPHWISGPLSEPLFVLGVVFVLLMLFAPGGLSSILTRRSTGGR